MTKPTEEVVLQWVDAAPAEQHELREAAAEMWRQGLLEFTRGESGDLLMQATKLGRSVARVEQQRDAPVCSRCGKPSGVIEEFMVLTATGSDVVEWMHEDCFVALPLVPKA
jgi:hypothetical protein